MLFMSPVSGFHIMASLCTRAQVNEHLLTNAMVDCQKDMHGRWSKGLGGLGTSGLS